MKFTRQGIDDFLIGLSIFISSYVFFKEPFEGYFHYIIFLGYLPRFIGRYGFPSLPLKFILLPAAVGIFNLILGNCDFFGFFKVFVGMLLSITFYNYVFIHYDYDFKRLFGIYLKGIVICAYIGIIELVSFRVGFSPGYNYSWLFNKWGWHLGGLFGLRVNSIFSEPSQFALLLSPGIFVATHHLFTRKFILLSFKESILIYVALILTTSSTGYIGIFVSMLLVGINMGRLMNFIFLLIIAIFGVGALYTWVPDFRTRVDASVNLYTKETYSIEDINSSSFVLYNNFTVAWNNLKDHPLFGTGLGSYPLVYEKYSLTKEEDFLIKKGFDFNSQDGNSLFIRSMAEMGIIGVVFWFFIIGKFFLKKRLGDENDAWIYSGAMLTIIFGYLLRQGNYFLNGFPFFVLFYCFLYNKYMEGEVIKAGEPEEEEV